MDAILQGEASDSSFDTDVDETSTPSGRYVPTAPPSTTAPIVASSVAPLQQAPAPVPVYLRLGHKRGMPPHNSGEWHVGEISHRY